MKDGWVYLKNPLILPQDQVLSIISDTHQTLHIGPIASFHFLDPLFGPTHLQEEAHSSWQTCLLIARRQPSLRLRGQLKV